MPLLDHLNSLRTKINVQGNLTIRHPRQEEMSQWYGGGVLVTNNFAAEFDTRKLVVRTHHAESLTWLIFELQDAFSDWLDFNNKYSFYGSFAQASLKHLSEHQPEAGDPRPLLNAVLHVADGFSQYVLKHKHLPPDSPVVLHLEDEEGKQLRIDPFTGKETV